MTNPRCGEVICARVPLLVKFQRRRVAPWFWWKLGENLSKIIRIFVRDHFLQLRFWDWRREIRRKCFYIRLACEHSMERNRDSVVAIKMRLWQSKIFLSLNTHTYNGNGCWAQFFFSTFPTLLGSVNSHRHQKISMKKFLECRQPWDVLPKHQASSSSAYQ